MLQKEVSHGGIVLIAGSIVGTTLTVVGGGSSNQQGASPTKAREPGVTPVAGPSWLNRLGLTYRDSSSLVAGRPMVRRPRHRVTVRRSRDRRCRLRCRWRWTSGRAERRRSGPARRSILPSGRRHWVSTGYQVRSRARSGVVARTGASAPAAEGKREPLNRRPRRRPLEDGPISIAEFRKAGNGCRPSRTCRRPTSTCSTPT